jgi:hypothetical protein
VYLGAPYAFINKVFLLIKKKNSQNLSCHPNDLTALEDFLRGLELVIDGWGSNSSSNCCTMPGITCNSSFSRGLNDSCSSNRVIKLELGKKCLFKVKWVSRVMSGNS